MPEAPRSKAKQKRRLRAGQEPGIGDERYLLIKSAAARISRAIEAGYPLEAVTLIESILAERLEKRAQYLHDHADHEPSKTLANVKDGFKTLGLLISALKANEPDQELRTVLDQVDRWKDERNGAVHEMAKLGEGARESWNDRVKRAHQIAEAGVDVLRAYDKAERRVSHEGRRRSHSSATCPDALGPIGQEPCSYCLPERRPSRRTEARRI